MLGKDGDFLLLPGGPVRATGTDDDDDDRWQRLRSKFLIISLIQFKFLFLYNGVQARDGLTWPKHVADAGV